MLEKRAERPAFGLLLRRLRIASGLTQELLAERARISVQAVSALERGVRNAPRPDTLALLAQTLGLREDELSEFEAAARSSEKPKIRTRQTLLRAVNAPIPHFGAPQFASRFIGREREVAEIESAIATGTCLTLWGTGGVGKTRLAVEAACAVFESFERVVFVALAPALDDAAAESVIATSLGAVVEGEDELIERISAAVGSARTLVVFDNCEQVVSAVAHVVEAILLRIPNVAIVCTTREPLRVDRESVFAVEPLTKEEAVHLFVDRASVATGPHVATPAELDSIEAICHRLDGIPLALELAAACVRALDVERIARGLDERFRLLARGSRSVERQATLRGAIAWSYDLLARSDRVALERIALVNGTFELDDALAIVGDAKTSEVAAMDSVAALVDKALIVVERRGLSDLRYRLLESTRAFCRQLPDGERADRALDMAQVRFGKYLFEKIAVASDEHRRGENDKLRAIDIDHVRGYLHWAIEQRHDVANGAKLAARLNAGWDTRGLIHEAIRWLETALPSMSDAEDDVPAKLLGLIGLARFYGRISLYVESREWAHAAYLLARKANDPASTASAAHMLGTTQALLRDPSAQGYAREALAAFETLGDDVGAANAFSLLALATFYEKGDEGALGLLREALARHERIDSRRFIPGAKMDLAEAEFQLGLVDRAIPPMEVVIAEYRHANSEHMLALALVNYGSYQLTRGRFEEARAAALEALEIGRSRNLQRTIMLAAHLFAAISVPNDRALSACARIFGYVDRAFEGPAVIGYTERHVHESLRAQLAEKSDIATVNDEMVRGRMLDIESVIADALLCAETEDG